MNIMVQDFNKLIFSSNNYYKLNYIRNKGCLQVSFLLKCLITSYIVDWDGTAYGSLPTVLKKKILDDYGENLEKLQRNY